MISTRLRKNVNGAVASVLIGDVEVFSEQLVHDDLAELAARGPEAWRTYIVSKYETDVFVRAAYAGEDITVMVKKFLRRSLVPWRAVAAIGALLVVFSGVCATLSKSQAQPDAPRATTVAFVPTPDPSTFTADEIRAVCKNRISYTDDRMALFFARAQELRVNDAIPKAILFAAQTSTMDDGTISVGTLAARDLLGSFTPDECRSAIVDFAPLVGWNPADLQALYDQVMSQ